MRRPRSLVHLVAAAVLGTALAATAPAGAARDVPGIHGGSPATPGEVPGAALVVVTDDLGGLSKLCTGTVVSATQVLTAAHCLGPTANMLVGLDFLALTDFPANAEVHHVTAATPHPSYAGESDFEHDVALLTLDSPTGVTPVALPSADQSALWDPGSVVTIAGWGESSPGVLAGTLQVADVTVVSDCAGTSMICAGDGDPSTCPGDSGGPMLADGPSGPLLVGVTVAGFGECGFPAPGLFAETGWSGVADWLAQNVVVGDQVAPRVVRASPRGFGVPRKTVVKAVFSEPVDPATVGRPTFRLSKVTRSGTQRIRDVKVRLSGDGTTARLDPFGSSSKRLAANSEYRVVVTTGVLDLAGNPLDQSAAAGRQQKAWTFLTGG